MDTAGACDDSAGVDVEVEVEVEVDVDVDVGVDEVLVANVEVLLVDDTVVGAAVGTTKPPVPEGMMSVATIVS